MKTKSLCWILFLNAWFVAGLWGGTFGRVVPIGGHASDLALDEARGVLYVANFTANRVEVMSTADASIQSSINVAAQPGSLALSRDGSFLLVTHFGNFEAPNTPLNAMTLIDLNSGGKQTFTLSAPPLGAGFADNNWALVVTSTEFLMFDPVSGTIYVLDTVEAVAAKTLPAPPANFPPQIIAASVAASGDGLNIYGLTDTIRFRYDMLTGRVLSLGYTADPPMGPRVVSVSRDGSYYAAGWGLFDARGTLMAQFPGPAGLLNVGSHVIDSDKGLIYAQIPQEALEPPVLLIADADNLTVRERLRLPENLAGKSALSSDGMVMYSVSDSGVMVLPVGLYTQQRRLIVSSEELLFTSGFCDRQVATKEIWLEDPSGANTDFAIAPSIAGITVTPSYGVTPARIEIQADPNAFQNRSGTVEGSLEIYSSWAVNVPPPVRVLINLREPDQRGTLIQVPGKLVDVLADPTRNRFYVLRQDRNQVLVFDGDSYQLLATLRTGNTPTQMAITFDRRYLLVGNDNSQIANVFDLETLQATPPIRFPPGHYPRSLAASGRAILAASRVAGPNHTIDRVALFARTAVELPTLGVYENNVSVNTVLVASGNGSSILAAQADGNVLLYESSPDTFTISRNDFESLNGAYAASSYGRYVVDNHLLNESLVPVGTLDTGGGVSSGFAFVDESGFLTTVPSSSSPGAIQRVDLATGASIRPTRMAEAPPVGEPDAALTRTVAPLSNRTAIVSLTTSGFTVLAWDYDASVAPPRMESVVNAADFTQPVAPGGLITVFGQQLSPVNLATREMPLPTALGESCLTANGVPLPMLFVSPNQINAQLPFEAGGRVTLVLHTPGGVSDNFNLTVQPAAPSVFYSGVAGPVTNIPTVVRASNNQLATVANPIHRGDTIVVYLTGLGRTSPAVETGSPAPYEPLAHALILPELTLGGIPLDVFYAGLTPGLVGVYQINALVPHWTPTGLNVPLTIHQAGGSTSLSMRVIE
jgi:uncharacterized protein (TIGR03437 family)